MGQHGFYWMLLPSHTHTKPIESIHVDVRPCNFRTSNNKTASKITMTIDGIPLLVRHVVHVVGREGNARLFGTLTRQRCLVDFPRPEMHYRLYV